MGCGSVVKMDPRREEVTMEPSVSMDIDPLRVSKRTVPLNLLTGVFLKSVFFLDKDLSRCVILGIFRNKGDSLGVVFKGKKGYVYWSHDVFNQFSVRFNEITLALEGKSQHFVKLESKEDIRVSKVFGRQHVFMYDGERTLTLAASDWIQFVNNLPLIYTQIRDLFMQEDLIQSYVRDVICNEEFVPPPEGLHSANRLFDEISLYKRWPNGSSSD